MCAYDRDLVYASTTAPAISRIRNIGVEGATVRGNRDDEPISISQLEYTAMLHESHDTKLHFDEAEILRPSQSASY